MPAFRPESRQAGQIKGDAPDERHPIGIPDRMQPFSFQARQDEMVDIASRPGRVLHRRGGDRLDRLPRPVVVAQRVIRDAGQIVLGLRPGPAWWLPTQLA